MLSHSGWNCLHILILLIQYTLYIFWTKFFLLSSQGRTWRYHAGLCDLWLVGSSDTSENNCQCWRKLMQHLLFSYYHLLNWVNQISKTECKSGQFWLLFCNISYKMYSSSSTWRKSSCNARVLSLYNKFLTLCPTFSTHLYVAHGKLTSPQFYQGNHLLFPISKVMNI